MPGLDTLAAEGGRDGRGEWGEEGGKTAAGVEAPELFDGCCCSWTLGGRLAISNALGSSTAEPRPEEGPDGINMGDSLAVGGSELIVSSIVAGIAFGVFVIAAAAFKSPVDPSFSDDGGGGAIC